MKSNELFTIKALLTDTSNKLTTFVDEPELESQLLLAHVLKKPRTHLLAWPETNLSLDQLQLYRALVQRRMWGEPIAYLIGERAFWSLNLDVTPATLIPRPETELIVEFVLHHFSQETNLTLADLGTGSGAIALAVAKERPQWHIVATDISEQALQVAKRNAELYGLGRIRFHQGDWCQALPANELYDVIVSNPPYLSEVEWPNYADKLAYEPRSALVSGLDGLDAIRTILLNISHYLKPNGYLMLEHGFAQASSVRELLVDHGFQEVKTHSDLAGIERVTFGQKPVNKSV